MRITLVGTGCGTAATLTEEGKRALSRADVIFGAARVIEGLPECCTKNETESTAVPGENGKRKTVIEAKPGKICQLLEAYYEDESITDVAVALSGDSGFYSGARLLKRKIAEHFGGSESTGPLNKYPAEDNSRIRVEILPGISSVQMFAAKIGLPWQDWNLVSAHGVSCDPVHEIMKGRPTFFLTGGRYTVEAICRELTEAGLGNLMVTVGENLSYCMGERQNSAFAEPCAEADLSENLNPGYRKERIFVGTAGECAQMTFSDLSVILVDTKAGNCTGAGERCPGTGDEHPLILPKRNIGIADGEFIRGKVPMTRSEVRCIIMSKMNVSEKDIVWDIGAGTGSVSIELAMQARQVWALEKKEEAVGLISENRKKFGRWNLHIVQGSAPEDFDALPVPDKVFVGGSGGNLREIMREVWKRNEAARICISATLLETLKEGLETFEEKNIEPETVQIAVSRAEAVGGRHMMKAGNPIFILTGEESGHISNTER